MTRTGWRPCGKTPCVSASPMHRGRCSTSFSPGAPESLPHEENRQQEITPPVVDVLGFPPRLLFCQRRNPDRGGARLGGVSPHLAHRQAPTPRRLLGRPADDWLSRLDFLF